MLVAMSNQHSYNGAGGAFNPKFHDSVIKPSPDFNFEEGLDYLMMPETYNPQQDFDLYDQNMHSGFPVSTSIHQGGLSSLSQNGWQDPSHQDFSANTRMPLSTQSEIVSNRANSVTQHFGQITPPQSNAALKQTDHSKQVHESDALKRKERARNAANKRHEKSKKSSVERETGGENETSEDRGKRQAQHREKNRVAAAKCRARKKNHNDHLEEMHRDEANKNKILKAELMGLRNELAQLKGLTLEHGPESCQCHGIHEYSMRQANLAARGAAPQYGYASTSPAQESLQSADTSLFEVTADALSSGREQMSPPMGHMSRRTSSLAPGS